MSKAVKMLNKINFFKSIKKYNNCVFNIQKSKVKECIMDMMYKLHMKNEMNLHVNYSVLKKMEKKYLQHVCKKKMYPFEIQKFILKYLLINVDIKIKIYFPKFYPHSPPTWNLHECKINNIQNNSMIKDYFIEIIVKHNCNHFKTWKKIKQGKKTNMNINDYIKYINNISEYQKNNMGMDYDMINNDIDYFFENNNLLNF